MVDSSIFIARKGNCFVNKSTDKDMSLLTFKAHRSKIQRVKNFHSHNTEEQLKITSRSPYPIYTKFGMRTFAYQA